MKLKPKELFKNAAASLKKINRKALISAGAVIIIGVAVLLNFLLLPTGSTSGDKQKTAQLGDLVKETAKKTTSEEENLFAKMTMNRQQARDEAMEVLATVTKSETALDSVKEEAMDQISEIAKEIESEANIESLVKAKGFAECVAVVSGDSAQIVVKSDGLLDSEIAQISEIVYTEAGVLPENLRIIESN